MEKYYVDACCNHHINRGTWAVIHGDKTYTGMVKPHKGRVNSGYCELYAVYQALQLTDDEKKTIIYNDNKGVVQLLNKEECYKKTGRPNYNELLRIVHPLYHNLMNVKVCKVGRKENRVADYLAKKTMKEHMKSENRIT